MANIINQLEISGITYDIQDNDAQNALLTKQDALVSGVNIKTINSESLLGSGNIVIEGGTEDAYTKAETDALLANKADTSAMTEDIEAAVSGKADTSAVTAAIDAAVSGKANSSDVYLKSSTSSSTEINNALEAKADASTTYSKTEVDTAINAATSGKADTSAVTSAIDAAVSGKADADVVYTKTETDTLLNNKADTSAMTADIEAAVSGKADTSAVTEAIDAATSGKADTSAVTAAIDAATSGKQDTLEYYQESSVDKYANIEVDESDSESEVSGSLQVSSEGVSIDYLTSDLNEGTSQTSSVLLDNDGVKFESSIDDGLGNLTTTMLSVAPSGASINDDAIVTESVLDAAVSGKADTSAVTAAIDAATSGKADSADVYTTAQTSSSTEISTALSAKADTATTSSATQVSTALAAKQDTLVSGTNIKTINNQSLLGSGNITIQGGGGANVVELTQAQYDALVTKDPDTFYIITDATPIDTSTFYTTAQTSSSTEIATALSGKQNTLTAGSGIDISNDVISVTGGGGTIDAALDANSPNAVANSAITAGINARLLNIDYSTASYAGSGVTILQKSYRSGSSIGIGYLSSINNKPIINNDYQTVNKFSLVETSAITTTLTSSSTDSQVPSAKAVYDIVGNINALLSAI